MKMFKNILVSSLLASILVLASTVATAQDLDKSVVKDFIQKKEFVFRAQSVMPTTGITRQLTTDYEVRFLGDSIVAYLPYFGRAYSAGYGEGGGIDFTSTKFAYTVNERRKGGWDITIKPQDAKDVQVLNFSVSENGYASLQVTSNNRQPISYNGYITERRRR